MLLRIMIAIGLLGLVGCVTTPDYRYTTVADGYGSSDNGYYTDNGYYSDNNASVGYYDGRNYGGYLTSSWGISPWFGYGGGWGLGYTNYGPYGFTPGWGSYYGSGWGLGFGSYWGGYAYSPFFPFYGIPYWYNYYPQHERHQRRDLSAVRAEQRLQADYQRSESRYRPDNNSAGIRMWTPRRHGDASTRITPRDNVRDARLQQAMLQRAPQHETPSRIDRRMQNTRPAFPTQRRYQTMPRGTPGVRHAEPSRIQPISRSTPPRVHIAPRPQATPSRPARATPRAMPRAVPISQPRTRVSHGRDLPSAHRAIE